MKKILLVILCIATVLCLVACGNKPEESTSTPQKNKVPTVELKVSAEGEGVGQVAIAKEGETPLFSDEYPIKSSFSNVEENSTQVIAAKAGEGSTFVKWTKDGEDYSNESKITVKVSVPVEYIAIFDLNE